MRIGLGLLADSRFDDRGAALTWTRFRALLDGQAQPAIAFDAPSWIRAQLQEALRSRGATEVTVDGAIDGKRWMRTYVLADGVDDELRRFLDLLSTTKSIGRHPVGGAVLHCIALDLYKVPDPESPPTEWSNTKAGNLINRYKYWSEPDCSIAFRTLGVELTKVVHDHPLFREASCVISVPGRDSSRLGHGERLAARVAAHIDIPFYRTRGLYDVRPEVKAGGFSLTDDLIAVSRKVCDENVLIVDDVFKSGHSLTVVANQARRLGASQVCALVGAKTLRN